MSDAIVKKVLDQAELAEHPRTELACLASQGTMTASKWPMTIANILGWNVGMSV